MKRKLFLVLAIMAVICFIFALSVSASNLAYDRVYTINGVEYPLWEQDANGNYHPLMWYQDGDKLSSVWADNTDSNNAPYVKYSAYVNGTSREMQNFDITDANGNVFNGKSTVVIANLHNIYLKANDNAQITHIHKNAFRGSTILKAVYIPESVAFMGWSHNDNLVSFENCKALEYVEFAPGSIITEIGCNSFLNCSALKAVSLPDSIKTINHSTFGSCTSLEAVYLPSGLETFVYHSWNKGAFYNCQSLYFVSEPFTVDNIATDIPSKPEVYYFPENLSSFGEAIRACTNINNTLVFGEALVDLKSNTTFTGTGVKGETKTAVFKGQMTAFHLGEGIDFTWNFVFINTTDESVFTARTDRNFGNSYAYLCKTNRKCLFNYGVKWSDETVHFVDTTKTATVEATCTDNKFETTYCYCNAQIGADEVENSALGHTHSIFMGIVYENYARDGYYSYKCEKCEDVNKEQIAPALFNCLGYSASEAGNGISLGFKVNNQAIEAFARETGSVVKYGVFAVAQSKLDGNDIFDENGNSNENAICVEIKRTDFAAFDIKITGFETEAQKTANLAVGAYVEITKDNEREISYIQPYDAEENQKYSFMSFYNILDVLNNA